MGVWLGQTKSDKIFQKLGLVFSYLLTAFALKDLVQIINTKLSKSIFLIKRILLKAFVLNQHTLKPNCCFTIKCLTAEKTMLKFVLYKLRGNNVRTFLCSQQKFLLLFLLISPTLF